MITQGIDAGTGETVGLDAAGTKARSAQADAPAKSLNSPTTTQGEALEAILKRRFPYVDQQSVNRPVMVHWFDVLRALDEFEAALQPNIDHAVGGVRELQRMAYKTGYNEGYTDGTDDGTGNGYTDHNACEEGWQQYLETLPALSAPQQPVKLDAVREAAEQWGPIDVVDNGLTALSEALFFLSDKLRSSGFLASAEHHQKYEAVVAEHQKLRASIRALNTGPATPPLDNTGLDADVAELVLRIGGAEWGATDPLSAEEHAAHVANSVRITASASGQEGPQAMHGLYVKGTETVICHAGTSPNSPDIARALAGAWNHLRTLALASGDRS